MMKRRLSSILILLTLFSTLQAQSGDTDFMRSTGKIYVVVAVILAIFAGLVVFLIYLDRKLTRLENQIKDNDRSRTKITNELLSECSKLL